MIAITDAEFKSKVLEADKPVLVDFFAQWCGPCKTLTPVLEELAGEFEGKIDVVKVDIDTNGKNAKDFKVMSIPTVLLFKGGEVVGRSVGHVPKNKLAEIIKPHL